MSLVSTHAGAGGPLAPATPHPNPPPQGGREPDANYDAVIVRTMPPGSLEQVVFRMDLLHRAQAATTFVQECSPPRERGRTWSIVSARLPQ